MNLTRYMYSLKLEFVLIENSFVTSVGERQFSATAMVPVPRVSHRLKPRFEGGGGRTLWSCFRRRGGFMKCKNGPFVHFFLGLL